MEYSVVKIFIRLIRCILLKWCYCAPELTVSLCAGKAPVVDSFPPEFPVSFFEQEGFLVVFLNPLSFSFLCVQDR
jgi:hypothetical protein